MRRFSTWFVISVLIVLPLSTSAATVSELQAQLAALMAQIAALQQGTQTTTTSAQCPTLSRTLTRGYRGTDITLLQRFLIQQGHLAQGNDSGFFGALTEAAVKKFQCKHMKICSGSPSTTGHGLVGARTRAAVRAQCTTTPITPSTPTCTPLPTETQVIACPTGQTGVTTQTRTSYCSSTTATPSWNPWVTTTSSCVIPPNPSQSCTLDGLTIADGTSQTFFSARTVSAPALCASVSRTCQNGTFSGPSAYHYANCTQTQAPSACAFNNQSVAHNGTVTAYLTASVPVGQNCTSQIRTCTNGTLSGSYAYASCVVSTATCTPLPTETRTQSCPAGETGTIIQTRTSSCLSGAVSPSWGEWTTTTNTCTRVGVTVPPVIVGYWSVGNINTYGDYIAETAAESNVAVIPPDETNSFIPRLQKARTQGLGAVLMVRDTLFSSVGGILYADYESRFTALWNSLSEYHGSIVGFYLIDEPYSNNMHPSGTYLSESQLKQNLYDATSVIQRVAPGRPVMFAETTTHVARGDFASLIPSNVNYIGVNCYLSYPDGLGYPDTPGRDVESCSEARAASVVQTLSQALQSHQKLLVTADGYFYNIPPAYSVLNDSLLRSRIVYWQNLLTPYFAAGKIGAFTPFIYQSVGDSLSGLNEFPLARAEIARYMQSIRANAPAPKVPARLSESANITASGTYLTQGVELVRDGNTATAWNAGGFAPQWIQMDLGVPYRISRIALTVGQSPAGHTTHVIRVSVDGQSWAVLTTFSGDTTTGQVLEYLPAAPVSGIRYVQIQTTESPSWVAWPEIVVEGY